MIIKCAGKYAVLDIFRISHCQSYEKYIGGDHGEKTVFEAFSRQYNPYFFIFVKEKWKYKISKGVAVAELPTGGSATVYLWYKNWTEPQYYEEVIEKI